MDLPPRFAARAAKLLAEPELVHSDACSWTGPGYPHPCTCVAPALLRAVARSGLDLEHPFAYVDHVDDLPNITTIGHAPTGDAVTKWLTCWKPVRFRMRGQWWIGIVKAQIQLADGTWIMHIEYGNDGIHPEWPNSTFVVWDPRLIRPIETEPPTP